MGVLEPDISFLYTLVLIFVIYKLSKWLYNYIYTINVINKIDGLYMLPLIGNLHQVKRGPGIS